MSLELILAFNLILLAALASPGPAMLMSIRTTLVKGRAAGIRFGAGAGLMASIWTMTALLGLEGIFKLFPWAYMILKTVGALYLLYLAWNTWAHARQPADYRAKAANYAFRDGMLVNLANPKSVLFAATVLIVIFPPELSLYAKGFIMMNQFIVEFIAYALFAFVLSTETVREKYLAAKSWMDRFAAVVLGALGLKLLIQR